MTVKIVVDSACDIVPDMADKLGITVVPVYINIGKQSYQDGVELPRQTFFENLSSYDPYPTTAAPASGAFTHVYNRLAAEGATHILSIHIATTLSAVYNAARLGAEATTAVPVTLFDTRQITAGAGLLAMIAAEAAAAGCTVAEIVAMLTTQVKHTRVFGMLETLDSLRRSGRVSWTQFGFGTLLQIKPIMMIADGEIEVVARVRTRTRAARQMIEMVQELQPFSRLAIIHVNAPEAAQALREEATALGPLVQTAPIMEIGPAVGTHLGQGAVGFACITENKTTK